MALSFSALLKKGASLSALTLVSRVLGLVREMTKAALLGTSALSDAFSVAFMLPNLFRRLFAEGSISVAFIPTFKGYLIEADENRTKEFLSCFFTFLSFFVSIVTALGIIAAPFLVKLFSLVEFDETVLLTRMMFPFLFFISIAALFQGILNSKNIFTPSALAPIILNIVTIACAYLLSPYTKNPARALAIGIFFGGFLEAAIQIPFVLRNGFRFSLTGLKRAINNSGTRTVLKLIVPTIVGMAAYQINDLVSTALGGRAGEGVVSSLQYSLRLTELILGVFAVTLGTILLPDLSEYAKSGNTKMFNENLFKGCKIIALLTIPISFFAFYSGEDLIRLLFEGARFREDSVALTLSAFRAHISGLFFIALNRVLAPAFYARSDTKRPTYAGIISFIVNMILALILSPVYKGSGIAAALSISSALNTAILLFFLKRVKYPNTVINSTDTSAKPQKYLRGSILHISKIILFSGIAILVVFFISPYLKNTFRGNSKLISIGVPFIIEAIVFAAIGIGLEFISDIRFRRRSS